MERAEGVSEDFARQFKEKMEGNKNKSASKLPLTMQADFAYLFNLAAGKISLPEDKVRRKELLKGLKATVRGYLNHASVSA